VHSTEKRLFVHSSEIHFEKPGIIRSSARYPTSLGSRQCLMITGKEAFANGRTPLFFAQTYFAAFSIFPSKFYIIAENYRVTNGSPVKRYNICKIKALNKLL
jgi:hypothetical protein